jgi:hypothetical protein
MIKAQIPEVVLEIDTWTIIRVQLLAQTHLCPSVLIQRIPELQFVKEYDRWMLFRRVTQPAKPASRCVRVSAMALTGGHGVNVGEDGENGD